MREVYCYCTALGYISSKQCGVIYNRAKAKAKGTRDVFVVDEG